MRGSRLYLPIRAVLDGSIPTCAGQPANCQCTEGSIRVYPHVCGAAILTPAEQLTAKGLSPRVRGSLHQRKGRYAYLGSIPTCAGQPPPAQGTLCVSRVYPHVCGAAMVCTVSLEVVSGLSPRVRGSLAIARAAPAAGGSIPTCAGQPGLSLPLDCQLQVYPHVCGAAMNWRIYVLLYIGLSPRVRGSRGVPVGYHWSYRSIPACAGQPGLKIAFSSAKPVYPHVCGAASPLIACVVIVGGLSPRVRGSLVIKVHLSIRPRSIPTCAGQPMSAVAMRTRYQGLSPRVRGSQGLHTADVMVSAVYPHVCGAAKWNTPLVWSMTGLSPRVRGSLTNSTGAFAAKRSIPTCAGQPCAGHFSC